MCTMCGGYVHSRPFGRASVTHGCCQARSLYEAGGAYELFAGRECGRALSQMCGCPGRRPARSPTLNATVGHCQVVRGRGLGRSCPRSTALSPQPPQRVDRFLRNEGLRTALPMQLPLTDWQLKEAALFAARRRRQSLRLGPADGWWRRHVRRLVAAFCQGRKGGMTNC